VCEVIDVGDVGVNNNINNNKFIFIKALLQQPNSNVADNSGILKENTER